MIYTRKQPVEAIQFTGENKNEVVSFVSGHCIEVLSESDLYKMLFIEYVDYGGKTHVVNINTTNWVVSENCKLSFYKDKTFKKTFMAAEEFENGSIAIDWEAMDKNIKDFFETFDKDKLFRGFHGVPKEKIQEAVNENEKMRNDPFNVPSNKTSEVNTDEVIGRMILEECSSSISEVLREVQDIVEKAFHDKIREEKYKSAWGDSEGNIHFNESTPEQMKLKAMYKEFMDNYKKMLDAWIEGGIEADANELQKYAVNEKGVESVTFDSVIDEMKELHAKKNKDYKGSFHDLFKEYGMPYALGHLEEKLNRVKAITANGGNAVKNDHIEDSVIDLASYAVMLYVELKSKGNGED